MSRPSPWPASLWLVGAGNMAGAMLSRWLDAGLDPARVTVIRASEAPFADGVRTVRSVPDGAPEVLMLGIKPQMLDAVAPDYAGVRAGVLVSILAGVEEDALARRFAADAIVRAMPNLPVRLGKGVVALDSASADAAARAAVEALMAPLGLVEWVECTRFDAVTALAGCGPGFVYRFIDALAAGGTALGLSADQAQRLAVATVEGAGALAADAGLSPAALADRVASAGGSTRAGLDVLDRDDALRRLLAETLAASWHRNAEMAAAARWPLTPAPTPPDP